MATGMGYLAKISFKAVSGGVKGKSSGEVRPISAGRQM